MTHAAQTVDPPRRARRDPNDTHAQAKTGGSDGSRNHSERSVDVGPMRRHALRRNDVSVMKLPAATAPAAGPSNTGAPLEASDFLEAIGAAAPAEPPAPAAPPGGEIGAGPGRARDRPENMGVS
jgi:hypothetical protein